MIKRAYRKASISPANPLVDARTKDGGSRRFFPSRQLEEAFAVQCRAQREISGSSAFANAELASFGWTIQRAIDFILAHLRAQAKSIGENEGGLENRFGAWVSRVHGGCVDGIVNHAATAGDQKGRAS